MKPSILYSSIRSPHCLKVAIFLHEKGITFERVEIDLQAKEQRTAQYLAINPLGLVPVYTDDEGIHCDSLVIMQYLDKSYPNPRLFPEDPKQLRIVMEWIELSNTVIRDVSHHLYWQLIEPPRTGTDWDKVAKLKHEGMKLLARLEEILIKQPYVANSMSAADIALLPWIHGYQRFDLLQENQFPQVNTWVKSLSSRPSFTSNYHKTGRPFLS